MTRNMTCKSRSVCLLGSGLNDGLSQSLFLAICSDLMMFLSRLYVWVQCNVFTHTTQSKARTYMSIVPAYCSQVWPALYDKMTTGRCALSHCAMEDLTSSKLWTLSSNHQQRSRDTQTRFEPWNLLLWRLCGGECFFFQPWAPLQWKEGQQKSKRVEKSFSSHSMRWSTKQQTTHQKSHVL